MPEIRVKRKCPHCGAFVHGKPEVFAMAVCCPKCRKRAVFEQVHTPEKPKTSSIAERPGANKSPKESRWSPRKRLTLIYILLVLCFVLPQYGIALSMRVLSLHLGVLYGWSTYLGIFTGTLAFAGLLLTAVKRGKSHDSFPEKLTHLTILTSLCFASIFGIILGLTGSYMFVLHSFLGNVVFYPYAALLIICLGSTGFLLTLGWDTTGNERSYPAVAYETICTRLTYLSRLRGAALGWCVPLSGWLILLWLNPNRGPDELREFLLIAAGVLALCGLAAFAISFWRKTGTGISVLAMAVCLGAGGLSSVLAGGLAASIPYHKIKTELDAFQERIRAEIASRPNDAGFPFLAPGGNSGKLTFFYDKSSEHFSRLTIELAATPIKEVRSSGRPFRVSGADLGGTGKFAHSTVIFDLSSLPSPKNDFNLYDAIVCSAKLRMNKDYNYNKASGLITVELCESPSKNTECKQTNDNVWTWDPVIGISGAFGMVANTPLDLTFLDAETRWKYECLGEVRGQILSLTVLATVGKQRYLPIRLECARGKNLSADIFVNGVRIEQNPFIKTYGGYASFRMPPFASAAAQIALPSRVSSNFKF